MADEVSGSGAPNDTNSLQNIARQLGILANAFANAAPAQTTTASPAATPINNLGTAIATVLSTSLLRHGLIFHNPGTVNVYVFPSLATAVTTTTIGGSFVIYPGGTLDFPSTVYTNINCGWSAWATTGATNPLTVIEFF